MFVRSWPEAELKRYSNVGLRSGCQQRNPPTLVLDIAGKTKTRPGKDVRIHGDIVLAATIWKIAGIERAVPKFEADLPPWAEPIIRSNLFALRGASDPGSDQASIVVVAAVVLCVEVDAISAEREWIRVSALKPEVEF